jgi:putative membrane-bound dehydrogenase-like protein
MLLTRPLAALIFVLTVAISAQAADKFVNHTFKKTQLSNEFFGEGASFADFNRDGANDVVSGPFWYAGPKFTERHAYYEGKPFNVDGYSDNFFAFTRDFNGDQWPDILIVGFPGKEAFWYENPQKKPGLWKRHVVIPVVDNESPQFTDVTGDGVPDLVCMSGGYLGYAEIPQDNPEQPWKFQGVSPNNNYHMFTHGLGIGDVNNDGRLDLLVKDGWWEQPATLGAPTQAGGEPWTFHKVAFSEPGGAQMFAYDFDGDGDNDVVTSKAAHAYGLAWFESEGKGEDGSVKFTEHKIMGERPEENEYGVAFSQLHAVDLIDMDGDDVNDIVTGKRWWAHSQHDPGSLEPAVLYWFKTVRDGDTARFVPHLIDTNSGVGTQVLAGDITGDNLPDIIVGNKKGTFVHTHSVEEVDEATWKKAQPKLRPGVATSADAEAAPVPPAITDGAKDGEAFPATTEDGRVLNLDFETGDLSDWTVVDGAAFKGQPVEGDAVHARRGDSVSGHQGKFWVGTYERANDGPQGVLRSATFKVTHPYASFLVGGGAGKALGVEIVRADTKKVVFRAAGRSTEEMQTAFADLKPHLGKEIFIRIIDRASAGWGHVNFDHFRFHDEMPKAEQPQNAGERKPDEYPYAGLGAEEAVKAMELPEGFRATVFAAEPDVKQPIAMALDDRGRVWIAEAYEYPVRAEDGKARDRILIFEDADGDGRFDKRTVFAEGLNLVSGIELGFGGVWIGAAPYLLFIPDRDGDDRPDGEPEILLDGWAYEDTHETLNTFIWGPDGWLYGCHGVFTHSRVGKPGTPDDKRIPLNAAIWRYHPTRHTFEIFTEGTSNPWGVDFDDHGQAFTTACVIPHLYHNILGARYQRQAGSHFNPYTYADIQTIADHRHYLGDNPHGGNGNSGDAGGGHAHSGAMIYLGGAWPEEYRGRIFMNNIHGQRLNTDVLKPQGSGYVGSHGPDFLLTGDLASQILNIRYGPDGNAFMIDWFDTNACHHKNVEGHDRTNGRIYKIVYGDGNATPVNLAELGDLELAELTLHKNDWYVRHGRRLLQERAAAGALDPKARDRLSEIATGEFDVTRRLRAMWTLHVTAGTVDDPKTLLNSPDDHVRAWFVRLSVDGRTTVDRDALTGLNPGGQSDVAAAIVQAAAMDRSPIVRLAVASALQRLPLTARWQALRALTRHVEDADDHNLPLMYWYAMEPLADADPQRALELGLSCGDTIPMLRKFMIRRIASGGSPMAFAALTQHIIESDDADEHVEIMQGLTEALKGQRQASPPENWPSAFAKAMKSDRDDVRMQAVGLGVTFGDQQALDGLRDMVLSAEAAAPLRQQALESLLRVRDPQLLPTLLRVIREPALRAQALSGLSLYDDQSVPAAVLSIYADLTPQDKRVALATLCARPASGLALLEAVAANKIPAADIPADLVRQLQNHKHSELDRMLAETWGQVRNTPEDKAKLIAELRELIANPPAAPDHALGRAIYAKTCQQCHTLYGVGAKIGPDLTGSNRADLEYLLSNIIDPSAVISKDYQQTVVLTVDGLVVSGLLKAEDNNSITLQTTTDVVVIPKDEIDQQELSDVSMMPDDQLKQFTPLETVSLFAYLAGKEQAPVLASKENQELFFNGKDLTGWFGDESLWSVEDGEIVGRSEGLDHNEFLFSDMAAEDFSLRFEVKLFKDNGQGNSGVQFRSEALENGEAKGYQADVGVGWWGKLYEESDRGLLWDKPGDKHVNKGEWNEYKIVARGSRVQTWLNGKPCVDLDDPEGKQRGIFALQIHSGGPMEVRFRKLKLEVLE